MKNQMESVISAARVFVSADSPVINNGAIAIRGDRIAAVGSRSEIIASFTDKELHLPEATLCPGLIDCHEHLMGTGPFAKGTLELNEPDAMFALVFAHACGSTLKKGVTTVRVPGTRGGVDLIVKRAAHHGTVASPRLWCAGQAITMTGGHGHGVGVEVDGPTACARAARSQLARGADFLKVMSSGGVGVVRVGEEPTHPEFSVEEMRAVVDVANAARRRVASHADGIEGISNSLEAGVHCIEHGIYLSAGHARHMASNNVALVPTLSTMTAIAFKTKELNLEPSWQPIAESILEVHRQSFRAALDAGVLFATGTDSFGDIVDEMIELTTYGISRNEAIRAATASGANVIGLHDVGILAPGNLADIIAVPGDPLEDLEVFREPSLVIAGGRQVQVNASACG